MSDRLSVAEPATALYHITVQYRMNTPHKYDVLAASPQEAVSMIIKDGWVANKAKLLADNGNRVPDHVVLRLEISGKGSKKAWYLKMRHLRTFYMSVCYASAGCLLSRPGMKPIMLLSPAGRARDDQRHASQQKSCGGRKEGWA